MCERRVRGACGSQEKTRGRAGRPPGQKLGNSAQGTGKKRAERVGGRAGPLKAAAPAAPKFGGGAVCGGEDRAASALAARTS